MINILHAAQLRLKMYKSPPDLLAEALYFYQTKYEWVFRVKYVHPPLRFRRWYSYYATYILIDRQKGGTRVIFCRHGTI